jgi:hypothetical protein
MRWKKARILVEIPYFHERNLDAMLKEELQKAINIRFSNPKYYPNLRHRFGKIRLKTLAKVLESLEHTGIVLRELDEEVTDLEPMEVRK